MIFSFVDTIETLWGKFVNFVHSMNVGLVISFAVVVVLSGMIIALCVGYGVGQYNENRFDRDIKYSSSTVRIIKIDLSKQEVIYFNTSKMRKAKKVPFETWIGSMPIHEQAVLKGWIVDLLEKKTSENYLEADVQFVDSKKTSPSFYKVVKVDTNKQIIHLENHLIRYANKNAELKDKDLSSVAEFGMEIDRHGTSRGMTFCFTLAPKLNNGEGVDLEKFRNNLSTDVITRFKKSISYFVKGTSKLIQLSPNEFIIANFDMMEKSQAISLALTVINKVERDMNEQRKKKANECFYEVRCGVVQNSESSGGYNEIVTGARYASNSQFTTTTNLGFFDKDDNDISAFDDADDCKSEVAKIVRGKKFVDKFRPVFGVKDRAIYGYMVRTIPLNTAFDNIDEMKNYAHRAKESGTLFSAIIKDAVGRFTAEKGDNNDLIIFMPTMVCEIGALIKSMPKMKRAKEANIVFVFKESDIFSYENKDKNDSFFNALVDLKTRGYSVSLFLDGGRLLLAENIYARCDHFFIDFAESTGDVSGTRIRSQISALVDKLVKFDKPIVASNLTSWMSIEMVVGAGIDYISSDAFSPYDDNLKPINKRSLDRLYGISERK